MTKQGRSQSGKFAPKSEEPRSVRTMRLTDTVWTRLGEIADSRGITRADLIEEWARQEGLEQINQLTILDTSAMRVSSGSEIITAETHKTGAELAHRITRTSGAITNWYRDGILEQKTKEHDPEHIAWERVPGSKKYRPIL